MIEANDDARPHERLLTEVAHLQRSLAALPDRDIRAPEEIIGYDEFGLPT